MSFLDPIASPLIAIEALKTCRPLPADGVAIFTSSNGVRFAPPSEGRQAYCVGTATTQRAQAAGWQAFCAGTNLAEMTAFFDQNPPRGLIFHLGGLHVRGDVAGHLRDMGLQAEHVPLYDQTLLPLTADALTALRQDKPVIVPLFSPRAAAHFASIAPRNRKLQIVALSHAVADGAGKTPPSNLIIASVPTVDALVASIEKAVQAISLG